MPPSVCQHPLIFVSTYTAAMVDQIDHVEELNLLNGLGSLNILQIGADLQQR